jgi:hypothetical protein
MPAELTAEDQLILLLARGKLSDHAEKRARALLARPLDWAVILEHVTTEEVYPLFYRNLERLTCLSGELGAGSKNHEAGSGEQTAGGEWQMADSPVIGPAWGREQLKNLCRINAFRNKLLTEELVRVLLLLHGAGIQTIPLKGVALAQSLYGDTGLRVCLDTDILVPRSKTAEAVQLLREQGYKTEFKSRFFARVLLRHDIEYALRREEREFRYLLELHWGVSWGASSERGAMEDLWAEACPSVAFGAPAYALSPEWQILFLSAHAARHRWQGLKWLIDLQELISSTEINWGRLDNKSKQLGWGELLRISVHACHALFGAPAPPNFPLGGLPSWFKLFPACAPTGLPSAFFATRFLKRPSEKLRYVARVFLIPTLAEWRLVSLPSSVEFLYYPLRPMRLLSKWGWALMARTRDYEG